MTIESDYYGNNTKWWVGIVKDTTSDNSTVKVRIFGIHHMDDQTDIPNSELPEALVVYPVTMSDKGGSGGHHNLTADTWVVGIWADGENFQQPIVLGTINKATGRGREVGSGGAVTGGGAVTPTTLTSGQTTDNAKTIFNYLRDKMINNWKVSKDKANLFAASFVGVWYFESKLNPTITNSIGATGLAQWLGGRKRNLYKNCPGSKAGDLKCQLDFAWSEIDGPNVGDSGKIKSRLLQLPLFDVKNAVYAITAFYERPEAVHVKNLDGNYQKTARNYAAGVVKSFGNVPTQADWNNADYRL